MRNRNEVGEGRQRQRDEIRKLYIFYFLFYTIQFTGGNRVGAEKGDSQELMINIQFPHRDHSVLIQSLYTVEKSAFTSSLHFVIFMSSFEFFFSSCISNKAMKEEQCV